MYIFQIDFLSASKSESLMAQYQTIHLIYAYGLNILEFCGKGDQGFWCENRFALYYKILGELDSKNLALSLLPFNYMFIGTPKTLKHACINIPGLLDYNAYPQGSSLIYSVDDFYMKTWTNYFLDVRYFKLIFLFEFFNVLYVVSTKNIETMYNKNLKKFLLKLSLLFERTKTSYFAETAINDSFYTRHQHFFDDAFGTNGVIEELSEKEYENTLQEISNVLYPLLDEFHSLLKDENCYELKAEQELALDLYEKLLCFKHPIFDVLFNYFDYQLHLPKAVHKRIFDLKVFMHIIVSINSINFYFYIFQKGDFISEKYDLNLKFPKIDFIENPVDYTPQSYAYCDVIKSKLLIDYLNNFDLSTLDECLIKLPLVVFDTSTGVTLESINRALNEVTQLEFSNLYAIFAGTYREIFAMDSAKMGVEFRWAVEPKSKISSSLEEYLKEEYDEYVQKNPIENSKYYYIIEHIYMKYIKG